jgi:tetratricopeptide (TPR) repeat protein
MRIRSYKTELLLAAVAVGVVGIMLLVNDVNRQIRIRELRICLQKNSREDNNLDHIGLLMKYRIHKRMYDNTLAQGDADVVEMRVNSILADITAADKVRMERYTYLSKPSLAVINFFRSIIRKDPIRDMRDDQSNVFLEIAYYYERNNYYARALNIYEKALGREKHDRLKKAGIHLHRGFCRAMLGNYGTAKRELLTVINDYGDLPAANTALVLLRYMEGFKAELDRILKNKRDSVDKGEKLLQLLAYRDALNVITRVEKKASPADEPRILYIKGRCLENLSRKEQAIDVFQKIINEDKASKYARLANRRIYISGALANDGQKVKELAMSNNRVLNDRVFDRMLVEEKRLHRVNNEKREEDSAFETRKAAIEGRYPVLIVEKIKTLGSMAVRSLKMVAEVIGPRPEVRVPQEIKMKIQTNDGNVFVGVIIDDEKDYIVIRSLIGNIRIPKSKITHRTEIE